MTCFAVIIPKSSKYLAVWLLIRFNINLTDHKVGNIEGGATTVRQNGNKVRDVFAALSNSTRLQMVELLLEGERSVNDIASALNLHQSGASQHLAVLTRAGILIVEPRGAVRLYKIREPRIREVLESTAAFCNVTGNPIRNGH